MPTCMNQGYLALCVPEQHGGLGADFETYCLVAEQLARGNASTALTHNMHALTMMMMGGPIGDLDLTPKVLERHQELSARRYREVVERGVFYAQPHSEPVETGAADELGVGGRRFGTKAQRVDGGYLVNGRKFFVSSAGTADYYATPRPFGGRWTLGAAHPLPGNSGRCSRRGVHRRMGPAGDAFHREP